ncbi:MAG: hypothetical protein FWF81_06050 [Defluviitaleaceae bacterium]|nr:hypothetical protein [Defluviitaleaceae bacterium]
MKLLALFISLTVLVAIFPSANVSAAHDVFTATFGGHLDMDVNDALGEWGIANLEDASVGFSIGVESFIFMSFDEPIRFTGNSVSISTNIPVLGDADAASTGARILSFAVDGNDLGERDVMPLQQDGDGEGNMTIEIARSAEWGGWWDAYNLAEIEPFSTLAISFIVENLPLGIEGGIELPEEEEIEIIEEIGVIEEIDAIDAIEEPEITPLDLSDENGISVAIIVGIIIAAIIVIAVVIKKFNTRKEN